MSFYKDTKKKIYALRSELRYFIARYPKFFFTYKAGLHGFIDLDRMIDTKTELVIEGFPCSANSFAVAAFKYAQNDKEINIAHHMHDPSQLIVAAKLRIPAIALIRCPDDAILSYVVRFSSFSSEEEVVELLHRSLKKYISFYSKILPYKEMMVIADFSTLISSYDSIVHQVNDFYGKTFNPFISNRHNVNEVFKIIEKQNKKRLGFLDENSIARPSVNKNKMKEKIRDVMNSQKLTSLLSSSHDLYNEFLS